MPDSWFRKILQLRSQSIFIPKCSFNPDVDIPDLSGKVIIVTGGNTGIGKETIKARSAFFLRATNYLSLIFVAQALLMKDAKVYMASRNKEKAEAAIDDLKRETGREAIYLELDLADLTVVKRAAETFIRYVSLQSQ